MNHFSNYLLTKFYKATYEYQYDAELNIFKEKVIEYAGMSLDEFSLHYMKVNAKIGRASCRERVFLRV